jgi:hypothetical protein
MRNWAFNILATASKKNARRRDRLFKYFNTESKVKTFRHFDLPFDVDLEKGFRHNIIDIESQVVIYDPPRDDEEDDEYEPIDWHT